MLPLTGISSAGLRQRATSLLSGTKPTFPSPCITATYRSLPILWLQSRWLDWRGQKVLWSKGSAKVCNDNYTVGAKKMAGKLCQDGSDVIVAARWHDSLYNAPRLYDAESPRPVQCLLLQAGIVHMHLLAIRSPQVSLEVAGHHVFANLSQLR